MRTPSRMTSAAAGLTTLTPRRSTRTCTMFSTRKNALLLAAVISLGGCTYRHNSPPVTNVEPVQPDEAMQRRDWAQSSAVYPNGAVAAGPTDFNYEPKH